MRCVPVLALFIPTISAFVVGSPLLAFQPPSSSSSTTEICMSTATKPALGSIVTIECDMKPEGDFVPEPLIDTKGKMSFVLGGGNYLPGLHDLVAGMAVGETVENVSLDAGWGSRNSNLVATIQKAEMGDQIDVTQLDVGVELYLVNGMKAIVTEISDDTFTIDANPPLAGASYSAKVELLNVEDGPKELGYIPEGVDATFHVATFSMGCFWGGELEFMRQEGVVGTKVGYTQGQKEDPSYTEVCAGTTGHTEAMMVTYDPRVTSYRSLVTLTMERLGENKYLKNQVGNDRGTQYRHGVYYHDDTQKAIAEEVVGAYGADCVTEVLPATKFYDAEDYHQQYLLKGGQSARKGDSTAIRCYG